MEQNEINGLDPNLTEEGRQSELLRLKNSYDMYEATKKDMTERRKEMTDKYGQPIYSDKSTKDTYELIETAQEDVREHYLALGGTEEELKAKKRGRKVMNRKKLADLINYDSEKRGDNVEDGEIHNIDPESKRIIEETRRILEKRGNKQEEAVPVVTEAVKEPSSIPNIDVNDAKASNNIAFDNIPIPSGGKCYKHKMAKIPVSYLTAYDENLIVSPNLYTDGTFLDILLKSKIMSSVVKVDELLPGDRDAIILWLRATGYGNNYPITVNDDESGESFETTVDLSKIKYKRLTIDADADGYFDFELPKSHDKIKFRFLTYGDIKMLADIEEQEKKKIQRGKINDSISNITEILENDEDIDRSVRMKVTGAIKEIKKYAETFTESDFSSYSHAVTNRLALNIVSVNGITDRQYLGEYIKNMNVMDSSAIRRYITQHEPGLDFNITIDRPESLGGGSINSFLQLDQYIFLNIA